MGLDQYLSRVERFGLTPKEINKIQHYIIWESKFKDKYSLHDFCGYDENQINMTAVEFYKTYGIDDCFGFKGIYEEVGYWRKANAIHKWFVDNIQDGNDDCGDYEVSKEQLEELLRVCKLVKENHSYAEEYLPTCSGFFFGDTEYDEYYFHKVDSTIDILQKVLQATDFNRQMIMYSSSW